MFKVGDRVKVVKANDSSVEKIIGECGVVENKGSIDNIYGQLWEVRLYGDRKWWLFTHELEHDKEHQVLEILRTWKNTR